MPAAATSTGSKAKTGVDHKLQVTADRRRLTQIKTESENPTLPLHIFVDLQSCSTQLKIHYK